MTNFNAVMDDSEVYGRAADTSVSMTEFRTCIWDTGLVQLPFTGCPFTWHNCSEGPRSLWKRLDRMLVNTIWMDAWPGSSYISALSSTSDHSPLILTGMNRSEEHVVFRFDNYLTHLLGFLNSVEEIWKHRIAGTTMYETVCKLKLLKAEFRRQKKLKGNLTENVRKAKNFLDKALALFTTYKEDIFLDLVKSCRRVYSVAVKLEISMLQQLAKLRCLKHGDQSSKVFFRKINATRVKQRVFQITKTLLGDPSLNRRIDLEFSRHELKHTITTAEANLLIAPVTLSEVKEAFFDIDIESAPSSDGYTSAFYRSAWPVVGQAMFQAVGEFFRTASFSVSLNGSIHGFFKGSRGLRQGDPMSPYLFVLVMEIWNSLLKFRVKDAAEFHYHWKLLTDTLNEFAALSGLKVNPAKSQIIFSERPLIDKVDARLASWNNLNLSYAGRLQLIKSVLSTLHTYWASAFILPKGVLKTLEKKMRRFLWHGSPGSGNAKVAWERISKLKEEGGLGIRSLITTNQALMMKQLWRILQNDGTSIWVDWIQRYRLRHSTIWTFNGALGSWGWKKMLKLRPLLHRGIIYKVGDGSSYSFWQDIWHERGPLCLIFPQGPAVTGLPLSSALSSVIQRNQWCWPASTDADIIDIMSQLPPIHSSAADSIYWRSNSVEKLSTMDKPWVPGAENGCVLCGGLFGETHDHLFFKCWYSKRCLTILKSKIKFQWPYLEWQRGLIWVSKRWRGTHLINAAFRATLAALVYHLWAERNNRKFSATSASVEYITSRVLEDVRMRILAAECPPSLQPQNLYRIWRLAWPIGL
ncbi:UNVERIFIED_CONTAM: hypothetical protein Sangu_2935000 [Sesamum angustifolium]|uniref:Reverse transcriptase domain-containing protein n=1 Tax=Sesamum angustifolium TaxID=2727405 RepID=A0AAW2ILZ4_9LAMI